MLRLRHLRHPLRAARSLYLRIAYYTFQRRARPQFKTIRRGSQEQCWCGGGLLPFRWHESYGVCDRCGAYVNRRPPIQEDLSKLYSIDLYWRTRQKLKGFPTIEARSQLYEKDGRVEKWMDLVTRYGPDHGRAVEVGCAPGVLLKALAAKGYDVVGVEISPDVATWLRESTNLDVRSGFFPGVELPSCNVFLAFDVLEHSPCPADFVKEAARLLEPGGIAVMQTVVDRYDFEPPMGTRFDVFDDLEHLYLFTDRSIEMLAEQAGLEVVDLNERIGLAGEICVLRKPAG